jgi:hypothetical protein
LILFKKFSIVEKWFNLDKSWSLKHCSKYLGHLETSSSPKLRIHFGVLGQNPCNFTHLCKVCLGERMFNFDITFDFFANLFTSPKLRGWYHTCAMALKYKICIKIKTHVHWEANHYSTKHAWFTMFLKITIVAWDLLACLISKFGHGSRPHCLW